jgi:hypothetical protein
MMLSTTGRPPPTNYSRNVWSWSCRDARPLILSTTSARLICSAPPLNGHINIMLLVLRLSVDIASLQKMPRPSCFDLILGSAVAWQRVLPRWIVIMRRARRGKARCTKALVFAARRGRSDGGGGTQQFHLPLHPFSLLRAGIPGQNRPISSRENRFENMTLLKETVVLRRVRASRQDKQLARGNAQTSREPSGDSGKL